MDTAKLEESSLDPDDGALKSHLHALLCMQRCQGGGVALGLVGSLPQREGAFARNPSKTSARQVFVRYVLQTELTQTTLSILSGAYNQLQPF
jgi:hypothetical protein